MWRPAAVAIVGVLGTSAQILISGPEGDCGLPEFKARHMTHFVEKSAVARITPHYPPAAKAKRLAGTVRVRVVINKQGLVERTCPVYARQERRPDRSLMVAAEAAALNWRFRPNFGVEPPGGVRFDYVYDVISFQFDPAATNKERP